MVYENVKGPCWALIGFALKTVLCMLGWKTWRIFSLGSYSRVCPQTLPYSPFLGDEGVLLRDVFKLSVLSLLFYTLYQAFKQVFLCTAASQEAALLESVLSLMEC